jgi:predicted transcriptional regulator of viral defense system
LGEALYHLRRNGWLVPLRRGLYALSSTVPGATPAHEFEVAMHLVTPAAISHWSALHHHGLTEQAPRKVFVLTTTKHPIPRRSGAKGRIGGYPIGETVYQFVQVKPERFFGTEKTWVNDARVTITDPERTLLDGLSMPDYCGDFAEVLHAFESRGDKLNVKRIIDYALKIDAATAKRLGWVIEKQGVDPAQLERLAQIPVKGYRILDPTGPRKGPCNRRWMIQENLPGKVTT